MEGKIGNISMTFSLKLTLKNLISSGLPACKQSSQRQLSQCEFYCLNKREVAEGGERLKAAEDSDYFKPITNIKATFSTTISSIKSQRLLK